MLNGLDLFSGIGGLSLAISEWVRPIAYCENDQYAQAVLLQRMHRGHIPAAGIWDDVTTLLPELLPGEIDIIYAGFPCQDISSAGLGVGLEQGRRSGLFFEIVRLIQGLRPPLVFIENVPAIRTRGLPRILSELSALRYDCRWTTVSAAEVGAPHLRKRWFLLAYSQALQWQEIERNESDRDLKGALSLVANAESVGRKGRGRRSRSEANGGRSGSDVSGSSKALADSDSDAVRDESGRGGGPDGRGSSQPGGGGETLADANGSGLEHDSKMQAGSEREPWRDALACSSWWDAEPGVGGMVNELSDWMDRGGGLGDAEAKETGADEVMLELWRTNGAEALQRATRGLDPIQATEVLFSFLREYEAGGRIPRELVESEATSEGLLRAMRKSRKSTRPPLRRRPLEQYFGEYPNALRILSQLVASRGEAPEGHPLWPGTLPRVAEGVKNRVDRLRGLGNAVVPLQARTAFMRLMGLETDSNAKSDREK